MLQPAILEVDTHGLRVDAAITRIEQTIAKAGSSVYRIRVIHGYNRGTAVRDGIYRELGHGLHPRVLRIVPGANQGITELVLREY